MKHPSDIARPGFGNRERSIGQCLCVCRCHSDYLYYIVDISEDMSSTVEAVTTTKEVKQESKDKEIPVQVVDDKEVKI